MGILVPVNIADFLGGTGHFAIAAQVIEEHEAAVEIDALQNEIGHHNLKESKGIPVLLELIIAVPDKGVSAKKVFIILPLIEDGIALRGVADGVEHIAVALAVHAFLEGLDGQAEIHLIGGDILADMRQVGGLDGVQEDEEAQDFIIGCPFRRRQAGIVLYICGKVDFLGDPEIIHGLAVPVADPGITHIIEIVQVCGIAVYHPAETHIRISFRVKKGFFP